MWIDESGNKRICGLCVEEINSGTRLGSYKESQTGKVIEPELNWCCTKCMKRIYDAVKRELESEFSLSNLKEMCGIRHPFKFEVER